jgi:hypothetical protein
MGPGGVILRMNGPGDSRRVPLLASVRLKNMLAAILRRLP